ncbi:hypothetical protein LTR66_002942 [Elasticomyces elasticus]|nr:hypothetical protein LTR66_002942 [Elasticomyces elasticus]
MSARLDEEKTCRESTEPVPDPSSEVHNAVSAQVFDCPTSSITELDATSALPPTNQTPCVSPCVTLSAAQLEQLAVSLAKSHQIQMYICGCHWDKKPLSSTRCTSSTGSSSSSRSRTTTISGSSETWSSPATSLLTDAAHASPLDLQLPELFDSLCLTDPAIVGQPIRYASKNFCADTNTLRVGMCTFLNLPFAASEGAGLSVRPAAVKNGGRRTILELADPVIDPRNGRCVFHLCASLDLTRAFKIVALTEFARNTRVDISPETDPKPSLPHVESGEECVDWCALAGELQKRATASQAVHSYTAGNGSPGSSNQETSDSVAQLLNSIEQIKALHRDFVVITRSRSENGQIPSVGGWELTYVSQHLSYDTDVVVDVAILQHELLRFDEYLEGDASFHVHVRVGVAELQAYIVPMMDGCKVGRWVVFLTEGEIGPLWD